MKNENRNMRSGADILVCPGPKGRLGRKVRAAPEGRQECLPHPSECLRRLPECLRHPSVLHSAFCILLSAFLLLLPGCFNSAGIGGTGEIVVPQTTLHDVQTIDPQKFATSQPTTRPTTAPAEVELTIEQCRQLALQGNLDLRVELINPSIARQSLSEDEAQFETLFVANSSYSTTDAATASQLNSSQATDFRADAGLSVPLRTGGTLTLTLPVDRFATNNSFSTLNPAYTSNLVAALSIPLLRGAGLYYNTQQIRIGFYQYQVAQARTKLEVITVLANVDRAYWRLYAARQELIVRRSSTIWRRRSWKVLAARSPPRLPRRWRSPAPSRDCRIPSSRSSPPKTPSVIASGS